MKPAAGINRTASNTVERVAKIAVKILTWRQNLTKIHSCAYSTSATSPASIMKRATLRNATNRCGGILCTLSIRCVTTRSSAIFGVGWRDSPTSPATHSPPCSTIWTWGSESDTARRTETAGGASSIPSFSRQRLQRLRRCRERHHKA